jgi:acyl carrier protein
MSESDVLQQTKAFLVENFMYMRRNSELRDDDSLLRTGVITSLGVMELVDWVESTFGLRVEPSEITEQNFDSPRSIARFVVSKSTPMASV